MTWQTIAFLIVAGSAFYISGKRFAILFKLMKAQTGKAPEIKDFGRRIQTTIVNVLGQKAVLQDRYIGMIHTAIFWGFIIISFGTVEQFLMTLYNGASFEFIGEGPYSIFLFSQDFWTFFVLLGVVMAAYRRLVKKPKNLGQSQDANNVLSLLIPTLFQNALQLHFLDLVFLKTLTLFSLLSLNGSTCAWFLGLQFTFQAPNTYTL